MAIALGLPLIVLGDATECHLAYPLAEGKPRGTRISFGKHKGQMLRELPSDYLEWLVREKPRSLQPGQLGEVERILREQEGRRRRDAEVVAMPRKPQPKREYRRDERAKLPLELDPEFFGDLKAPR